VTTPADPEQGQPYVRQEDEAQRLDRNYLELLQELRVAETGVQILFAFLLSIAFQQRFAGIDAFERNVYVATLLCAAVSTAMLIAPVAFHRLIFRKRRKDELVDATSRLALGGMAFLLLAIIGAVLLILDYVLGRGQAIGFTAVLAAVFGWFWIALPLRHRDR